jgi:hypothetical protein
VKKDELGLTHKTIEDYWANASGDKIYEDIKRSGRYVRTEISKEDLDSVYKIEVD